MVAGRLGKNKVERLEMEFMESERDGKGGCDVREKKGEWLRFNNI